MKLPACENIELQKHPWVRGCVNGAFSAGPTRALRYWLTDNKWHFVSRERAREGTERGERKERKRIYTQKGEGGALRFWRPLQSGALYAGLKCLITWPVWPLAPLSEGCRAALHQGAQSFTASKATIHPPSCSRTPEVIGKSNVSDLHFRSLCRRAKLLRSPDNVRERGWPFWLLIHFFYLAAKRWSRKQTELHLSGGTLGDISDFHASKRFERTR